jgi:hypothetical protein
LPAGAASNAFTCFPLTGTPQQNLPGTFGNFVLASATTDANGRYQLVVPATAITPAGPFAAGSPIDIAIEIPQGANGCAPGSVAGTPNVSTTAAPPLAPGPGLGVTRCTITMGTAATAPVAGAWNDGASFVVSSQNLVNVPGGESATRRLEAVIPFYANTPDTARLGGWDLETSEIRVSNSGASRTVAEIDFYATDANGNVSTAATQTVDLAPGAGASLRPSAPGIGSQIPGGSIGWAGVFSTIPSGQTPGGLYSLSNLVAVSSIDAMNAGGARTIINGVPREEIVAPNGTSVVPLAFRNYGGTGAKWSTQVVAANMGSGTTVVFNLFSRDTSSNSLCQGSAGCVITRTANAGGVALLNLGDNSDPDVANLTNGSTWTVVVQTGGTYNSLVYPGAFPSVLPAGMATQAINVSVVGKAATSTPGIVANITSGFPPVISSPSAPRFPASIGQAVSPSPRMT